ncbi:MAG: hypothetical protein V3V14_02375, partial [Saprospiraceae bacterium]
MKTNYKNLFLLLCFVSTMAYSQQTVFFDFGDSGAPTSGNYNNPPLAPNNLANEITDLVNDAGSLTGFGWTIHDAFEWRNTSGISMPTGDAAIFDSEATNDSYFGSTTATENENGGFTLTGLNDSYYYSFEIFASR